MNWGQLTIVDLFDCDKKILLNQEMLGVFSALLCKEIRMKPFGMPIVKRFGKGNLHGLSLMQFIETSSIVIHLDDRGGRAFIDIFSCKKFDEKKTEKFCKEYFKAEKSKVKTIFRG